jgi:hypothetical protein
VAYCALHKREFPDTDPCPYCKACSGSARIPPNLSMW